MNFSNYFYSLITKLRSFSRSQNTFNNKLNRYYSFEETIVYPSKFKKEFKNLASIPNLERLSSFPIENFKKLFDNWIKNNKERFPDHHVGRASGAMYRNVECYTIKYYSDHIYISSTLIRYHLIEFKFYDNDIIIMYQGVCYKTNFEQLINVVKLKWFQ